MSFNTLIYIVASIVPVCMFIRLVCDIRDALKPQAVVPVLIPPTLALVEVPQFQFDVETLLTPHAPQPLTAEADFAEALDLLQFVVPAKSSLIPFTPKVATVPIAVAEKVDLSKLTIRELKAIAKERKLKGYGDMRKAELVAALS